MHDEHFPQQSVCIIVLINSKLLPSLMLMNVSEVSSSLGSELLRPGGPSVRIVHGHFDVARPQKVSYLSRSVLPTWDLSQMGNKTYNRPLSKQQYTFISSNNSTNDYKFKPPRPSCWKMMKSMFGMVLP